MHRDYVKDLCISRESSARCMGRIWDHTRARPYPPNATMDVSLEGSICIRPAIGTGGSSEILPHDIQNDASITPLLEASCRLARWSTRPRVNTPYFATWQHARVCGSLSRSPPRRGSQPVIAPKEEQRASNTHNQVKLACIVASRWFIPQH